MSTYCETVRPFQRTNNAEFHHETAEATSVLKKLGDFDVGKSDPSLEKNKPVSVEQQHINIMNSSLLFYCSMVLLINTD